MFSTLSTQVIAIDLIALLRVALNWHPGIARAAGRPHICRCVDSDSLQEQDEEDAANNEAPSPNLPTAGASTSSKVCTPVGNNAVSPYNVHAVAQWTAMALDHLQVRTYARFCILFLGTLLKRIYLFGLLAVGHQF